MEAIRRYDLVHAGQGINGQDIARPAEFLVDASGTVRWVNVRVRDNNGNPIKNALVKLESTRSDGFFCESWGETDSNGIITLLPIHMGSLKFKVKAKGYHSQELDVPANQLGDPVHVTLKKK